MKSRRVVPLLVVAFLVCSLVLALPRGAGAQEAKAEKAVAAVAKAPAADVKSQDGWTGWRGPNGHGAAPDANPPTTWSEEKNIRWKVKIPGMGASTPIIIGDVIYAMTAVETDKDGEPPKLERPQRPQRPGGRGGARGGGRGGRGERGGRGGRGGGMGNLPAPKKFYEFAVVALDRKTGKKLWNTVVKEAVPHEGGHSTGSQASGSPVTDGEYIYAFFGSRGVHCLDLQGKKKWSKDLGYMFTRNSFGEGASPALHGDFLVVNWDHEGDSFIVALDKKTGKERWRTPRDESTSWGTPVIATVDGKPQVIVVATKASRAYDLETGKLVWSLSGMTTNCIPTPILDGDTVYLMSGFRGAALQSVKLSGAKGDLDELQNVKWRFNRGTSYVPSALLYENRLYFVRSNNGVLTCLDATTGEVVYEGQRLAGLKTIYSSPVAAKDRIYLTSREGTTKVFAHGKEFKELATNQLDDVFDASAAIVGDAIYLRGREHFYCIAAPN